MLLKSGKSLPSSNSAAVVIVDKDSAAAKNTSSLTSDAGLEVQGWWSRGFRDYGSGRIA